METSTIDQTNLPIQIFLLVIPIVTEKGVCDLDEVVLCRGVQRGLVEGLGHRLRVVLQQQRHSRQVTRPRRNVNINPIEPMLDRCYKNKTTI